MAINLEAADNEALPTTRPFAFLSMILTHHQQSMTLSLHHPAPLGVPQAHRKFRPRV